jgi:hypothetical protein
MASRYDVEAVYVDDPRIANGRVLTLNGAVRIRTAERWGK